MTLDEYSHLYCGVNPLRECRVRDMSLWYERGLLDRVEAYLLSPPDETGRKFREVFKETAWERNHRKFSAQHFFNWCGIDYGGTTLYVDRFDFIDYEGRDSKSGVCVRSFDTLRADMHIKIADEMVNLPVWSCCELGPVSPRHDGDGVGDVIISVMRKTFPRRCGRDGFASRWWTPVMDSFLYRGDYVGSGGGFLPWDSLEQLTEDWLWGAFDYVEYEDASWDFNDRDSWDNEAETMEAMGYDSEDYVHDRDSWMYW